ncbi:unnamed protein product [Hapterophycus canaliculatus]
MKRGKRCFIEDCLAAAPFASPSNPDVHACEIHKKRDFVNMRNKRCLEPGCYRNPHYGVSRLIDPNSKAQYCTKHKAPGMQNVNGGRCAGPDCSKQPRFSLPGEKGKYCSKHREDGMVDVLYTPCAAEGCTKHPHFGHVEGGPRYCAKHRAEGMVDVKHRRCAIKSCRKDRVLIPGSTLKRGKFCEVHCDVSELTDKDAVVNDDISRNKKRSRVWMGETEDEMERMSSEGSQVGSSMGDAGKNMNLSYDYSSTRSVGPSIREAAQGLAHLATLARRERTPQCSDEAAASMSRGRGHIPGHGSYQPAEHSESFSRGAARALASRGPSQAEREHHVVKPGSERPLFYPASTASSEPGPYPLFKRDRLESDAALEAVRPRMSPGLCSNTGTGSGTPSPAPASPFRLRYFEPESSSSEYSAYPPPWECTRERPSASWTEGSNVSGRLPTHGWNNHPSAP